MRACRADRCRAPQDEDDKPDEPEVAAKPEQKLEPEPETETTEQTTIEGSDDHAPVKTVSIATQTDPEDADDLTAYKFTQDMMDRVEAAEDRTAAAESKLRALEKAIVDTNGWGDWVADLPDDVKESLIEAGYEHDDIYEEDSDEDDEQAECGTCGQKFDEDGNPVDGGMGCHKCCPSSEEDDSSEDDSSDSSDDY
eukprot:COSAG01_NODE_16585_length_1223_cov_2.446619_2_plen_196_part_00